MLLVIWIEYAYNSGSDWVFKNKDHGMLSATASLGLIMLWDVDNGYTTVDKYIHSKNSYIQAGAVLATGMPWVVWLVDGMCGAEVVLKNCFTVWCSGAEISMLRLYFPW